MASDDKKIKTNSAPENEAPSEKKSASGAEPSCYSRGEGQKPVSKAYRDNWNVIFAKNKEAIIRSFGGEKYLPLCSGRLIATSLKSPAAPVAVNAW